MSKVIVTTPNVTLEKGSLTSLVVDNTKTTIVKNSNSNTVVVTPSDISIVKSPLSIEGQQATELGSRLTVAENTIVGNKALSDTTTNNVALLDTRIGIVESTIQADRVDLDAVISDLDVELALGLGGRVSQNELDITNIISDLVSVAPGKGASTVGIADVDGNFTAQTVEDALKELAENTAIPPDPIVNAPSSFSVQVGRVYNVLTENGVITRAYLQWTDESNIDNGFFEVQKKISSETVWEDSSQVITEFSLENVQPNINYDFRVRRLTEARVSSDWVESLNITIPVFAPVEPEDIPRVTGLTVEDGEFTALGTFTWFGTSMKIYWRDTSSVIQEITDSSVANENRSDWFNAGYKVCIYINSTEVHCVETKNPYYTLPREVFKRIGSPRTLTIKVWGVTIHGTLTNTPATMVVTNPPPKALTPSKINIQSGWARIVVGFIPPSETDYAGASVYVDTVPNFTPTVSNKVDTVYRGTNTLVIDQDSNKGNILPDTTYYVVIGVFDYIDESTQAYSSPVTVVTNKAAEDKYNALSNWARQIDPISRTFIDNNLDPDPNNPPIAGDFIVDLTVAKLTTGVFAATETITCEGIIKTIGTNGYDLTLGQHTINGIERVLTFGNGSSDKFYMTADGDAIFSGTLAVGATGNLGDIDPVAYGEIAIANALANTANTNATTANDWITATGSPIAVDYAAENNMKSTPVVAATMTDTAADVEHTINTDGTCNISLDWLYNTADIPDIDGFIVTVRVSTESLPYVIGTNPSEELSVVVPADKSSAIFPSVSVDLFYTFGVTAYRVVHPSVDAVGTLYSSTTQPQHISTNPYLPDINVAFSGDITGTIAGTSATTVRDNAASGSTFTNLSTIDFDLVDGLNKPDNGATANHIFAQPSAPTSGMVESDIWLDTDDGNKFYRYESGAWVSRRDGGITQALQDAANALAAADGVISSYYQGTEPVTGTDGDFWIHTGAGNRLYVFDSGAWVDSQDSAIGSALQDAADAQATADGKVNTYFTTDPEPAPTLTLDDVGDLWFNTTSKLLQRWSGTAWAITSNAYTEADLDVLGMINAPAQAGADRTSINISLDTSNVNGTPASFITSATNNYNTSNDRNNSPVVSPSIVTDGTAIDHTVNTDGSCSITFEWVWAGAGEDIDGFIVFVRSSTATTSYTFNPTSNSEPTYVVPADKRVVVLEGIPSDRYYTFGVMAYRAVHKNISASGVLYSLLVQPTLLGESPYLPASSVAFTGDILGTIEGTPASTVVNNATNGATFTSTSDLDYTKVVGTKPNIGNLIDPSKWAIGTNGSQPGFAINGTTSENEIVLAPGPVYTTQTIWRCTPDANNDADGGWNTSTIPIDPKKTYRSTVWVKRDGSYDGSTYFGCSVLGTLSLSGSVNTNPYFLSGLNPPILGKWYLMVGLIHGSEYTGGYSGVAGLYDPSTGLKVTNGTEFKSTPTAQTQIHRAYLFYATQGTSTQDFAAPRFEEVNGNEISIQGMMEGKLVSISAGADVTALGTSLDTSNVNGTPSGTVIIDITNAQNTANDAITDAAAANSLAGQANTLAASKIKSTVSPNEPSNPGQGDYWYDTTPTVMQLFTRDGSAWVAVGDVTQTTIDGGLITTGYINIGTSGSIYSGKGSFGSTSPGWWLGDEGGIAKFNIGDATSSLSWEPIAGLVVTGTITGSTITGSTITGGRLQTSGAGGTPRIVLDGNDVEASLIVWGNTNSGVKRITTLNSDGGAQYGHVATFGHSDMDGAAVYIETGGASERALDVMGGLIVHRESSPSIQVACDVTIGDAGYTLATAVRGTAIYGTGVTGLSTNNIGTKGSSIDGTGVYAESNTGYGLRSNSLSGMGIRGFSISNTGIEGESTTGVGISGVSDSNTGIQGESTTGVGILGISDTNTAVQGNSDSGDGMYGVSISSVGMRGVSTSNIGVSGLSTDSFGVFGESYSNSVTVPGVSGAAYGIGVKGEAYGGNSSSIGVLGDSFYGTGVKGTSNFADGVSGVSAETNGVYGESYYGNGVYGIASTVGGIGVHGQATGAGYGVRGSSPIGFGVHGETDGNSAYAGVVGSGNTNGVGVFGVATNSAGVRGNSSLDFGGYFTGRAALRLGDSSLVSVADGGVTYSSGEFWVRRAGVWRQVALVPI